MSDRNDDANTGGDASPPDETDGESSESAALDRTVERAFTCPLCGYAMTDEVGLLRAEVSGVCHNCGDWTTQTADREVLVDAAEEAAAALAGPILTERQALAYVLRELLDADRDVAAEVMDSSPSNVDNLQRRASEKAAAARDLVDALDALDPADAADASAPADGGGE